MIRSSRAWRSAPGGPVESAAGTARRFKRVMRDRSDPAAPVHRARPDDVAPSGAWAGDVARTAPDPRGPPGGRVVRTPRTQGSTGPSDRGDKLGGERQCAERGARHSCLQHRHESLPIDAG